MKTVDTDSEQGGAPSGRRFVTGRSALIWPLILVALGTFLVYGTITMEVPETATSPGPQVFPAIVAGLCYVLALLLAVQILLHPDVPEPRVYEDGTPHTGSVSNWRTLGITVASVALFIVLLNPLGWILAGAVLFWGVSVGLGSRRYLFDLGVALAVSSVVQLAFSAGLGLTLPGGLLAEVF